MDAIIQPREQAYLEILDRGLVRLRNCAYGKQTDLCEIEADHLHNIPSLLHEDNEHRHAYYIMQERGLYLERLRKLGTSDDLRWVSIWYSESWWVLACAARVTLAES